MPRGKVFNQSPVVNALEDEVSNKQSSAKFTLITPDSENDMQEDESAVLSAELDAQKTESHSMNFKFTILLVTLFVAVNIGLVALLDNDKPEMAPAVSAENKVVKLPEGNLPIIKDNNAPHKARQVDVKPELPDVPFVQVAPVDTKAASDKAEFAVQEKPVLAAPVSEKRASSEPVVREDLLSIIGKE